ncbi:MAG: hypothetical protein KG003_05200 [Bacteroidetes bacterium]|nr:hypothetical protein [Bacteroidota bacterium]
MLLKFNSTKGKHDAVIQLPESKSISNRYLILKHLFNSKTILKGLSQSRDTQLLKTALELNKDCYWFEDGATPMRFFLAYAAARNMPCKIEGTPGLSKRSNLPLTQALSAAGAIFSFEGREGYLPIVIEKGLQHTSQIHISRELSSQFVSALMLVSPLLSGVVHLYLHGPANSEPYIQMTKKCMQNFGISSKWNPESNCISIHSEGFLAPAEVQIETDWSSASYFYSLVACYPEFTIQLQGLKFSGMQGDEIAAKLFAHFGVKSEIQPDGILLQNIGEMDSEIEIDFTNCIDLAPAIICCSAYLNASVQFKGIHNLVYKESNRLEALQANLKQFGVEIIQKEKHWELKYEEVPVKKEYSIQTFNDHRIAMAMSIFAMRGNLNLDETESVVKSFPGFWSALGTCNFELSKNGA